MCRSIKVLRQPGANASPEEISAAARQFVRKVSGQRTPSRTSEADYEQAIAEVAKATEKLLRLMGPKRARPLAQDSAEDALPLRTELEQQPG
jgi:hypothetical protein